MSIVKGEKTKNILMIIAAALLVSAIIMRFQISENDEMAIITNKLSEYGYYISDDSVYIAGDYPNTTISDLLSGIELSQAVNASLESGFPSNIDKRGDIVLILAATKAQDVITLYMLNGEMELCFIQRPNTDEVFPLGKENQ